ncbi:MAG TPA: hypothetical protein VF003_09805 [Pseudonocardiaceae bacterium]
MSSRAGAVSAPSRQPLSMVGHGARSGKPLTAAAGRAVIGADLFRASTRARMRLAAALLSMTSGHRITAAGRG